MYHPGIVCSILGLVITFIFATVYWHWTTYRRQWPTAHDSGFHMPQIRPPTRTEDLDTPRIDDGSLPRENASSYESWAANAEWEERSPGRHTSVSEMEAQQEQAEAASVSAQDFGRGVEVGNPVWNENEGVGTQESVDLSGCQD